MKICAIGDPHGDLEKIRKIPLRNVDAILLTGDLGSASLMRKFAFDRIERRRKGLPEKKPTPAPEKCAFMEAYNSTVKIVRYLKKFAPVYTIFGNVESSNYQTRKKANKLGLPLPFLWDDLNALSGVRVINNRVANIDGVRVGGLKYFVDTNWVRDFKPSKYHKKMSSAKKESDKARRVLKWFDSLDILVCHQPPFGVLDKVTAKFAPKQWQGKEAGSKVIFRYVGSKQPRYVVCGHIHEGKGVKKVGDTEVYNLGVADHKIIEL